MSADVSVIIPYYNNSDTLERALESVKSQTYSVKKVIVVDDGSADHFLLAEIVNKFTAFLEIKLIKNAENRGVAYARNRGIEEVNTAYIAFLDADDAWLPSKIKTQYCFMQQTQAMITGHGYASALCSKIENNAITVPVGIKNFLYRNFFPTSTVMLKIEAFIPFDIRLVRIEDYKCWVSIIKTYGNSYYLPSVLARGFKPPVGHSGLSASIEGMHKGWIQALTLLKEEKIITFIQYWIALVIEYAKFPLRKMKYKFLLYKLYKPHT